MPRSPDCYPPNPIGFELKLEQGLLNGALYSTIGWLKTEDYRQNLFSKNLPPEVIKASLQDIYAPDSIDLLIKRARKISYKAGESLINFFGEPGDIIIPFSGGRDSTAIAFLTACLFSDRKIWLVTTCNGFEKYPANASKQAKNIQLKLGSKGNLNHLYADLSDGYDKFVVSAAYSDYQTLGHPGVCSACKILMEDRFARMAGSLGARYLAFGYVYWQAQQQWPEQNPR